MAGERIRRRDYATGLFALFIIGIVLLPVGGVIILGLLTPFIIVLLILMAFASLFTRRGR